MMGLVQRFGRNTSGATAIEYALIAGLVSVVIVTALTSIGTKMNTKFNNISASFN